MLPGLPVIALDCRRLQTCFFPLCCCCCEETTATHHEKCPIASTAVPMISWAIVLYVDRGAFKPIMSSSLCIDLTVATAA